MEVIGKGRLVSSLACYKWWWWWRCDSERAGRRRRAAAAGDWTGGGGPRVRRGHVPVPGGGEATAAMAEGDSHVSRGSSGVPALPTLPRPGAAVPSVRCLAVTPSSCEPRPALLCCLCSPCLPMAIRCLLITLACQCSNSSRFRLWSDPRSAPIPGPDG